MHEQNILPIKSGSELSVINVSMLTVTNLNFYNLDVYITTAPYDLVILDKDNTPIKANAGDLIIKSYCRGVLLTVNPITPFAEVFDLLKTQHDIKMAKQNESPQVEPSNLGSISQISASHE